MNALKKKSQEPILFLFKKMWKFAKGHRHFVVIYLSMFVVANIITLTPPLVFGKFLNEIQHNGLSESNITYLVLILLGLLVIKLGFWMFHGPSRVMENLFFRGI